jgi:hypothetical protein
MSSATPAICLKLRVPNDACNLLFGDDAAVRTTRQSSVERLGYTVRGEELLAHYDENGRIIEIDLLSDDKPCQTPEAARRRNCESLREPEPNPPTISSQQTNACVDWCPAGHPARMATRAAGDSSASFA